MSTGLLLKLLSGQARRIDGCSCKNKWSVACAHCSHSAAALATTAAEPGDHGGSTGGIGRPHARQDQTENTEKQTLMRKKGKANLIFFSPLTSFFSVQRKGLN